MEIKATHTGIITTEDVLEAIKELFRIKGFEPEITEKDLKKLIEAKCLELSLTSKNEHSVQKNPQSLIFHKQLLSALEGRHSGLQIFFAHLGDDFLNKKLREKFTKLSENFQKILIVRFQLNVPLVEVKKLKIADTGFSIIEINKAISAFGELILTSLRVDIENCRSGLKEQQTKEQVLDMTLVDCYFSARTYNSFKSAQVKTVKDLVVIPQENMMRWRNFGQTGIQELNNFKVLFNL